MRYHIAALMLLPWATLVWSAQVVQDFAPLETAVMDYILSHADPQTRYEITLTPLDPRLRLPVCSQPVEAFAPPGYRPMGTATVGVRCSQDRSWTLYITAHIKAFRYIAILTNAISRGISIKATDIVLREQDVSSLSGGYFFDEQQIIGKLAKRALNAGIALSPNELAAPRWVSRGQVVTLFVDSGGLQVRAQGEAMVDGAENDLIKVRNVVSGKIIDGFVTAPGIVKVKM